QNVMNVDQQHVLGVVHPEHRDTKQREARKVEWEASLLRCEDMQSTFSLVRRQLIERRDSDLNRPRIMDDLQGFPVVDRERRSQHLMASDYFVEATLESRYVERTFQSERDGQTVGGIAGRHLIHQPH